MKFDQANDDFVPLTGFANPCATAGREELGAKASQKLTGDDEDGRVTVGRRVGVWFLPRYYFDGGKARRAKWGKRFPRDTLRAGWESGSCGRGDLV